MANQTVYTDRDIPASVNSLEGLLRRSLCGKGWQSASHCDALFLEYTQQSLASLSPVSNLSSDPGPRSFLRLWPWASKVPHFQISTSASVFLEFVRSCPCGSPGLSFLQSQAP